MEKQQAITKAIENITKKRTDAAEAAMVDKVERLLCKIESLSQELREAKKELAELQYEPPTIPAADV